MESSDLGNAVITSGHGGLNETSFKPIIIKDINEKKISFLDKFHILSPDTEENIARNIDIKLELENIAKTGSCTGLAEYIFDLIIYTRGITNTSLN